MRAALALFVVIGLSTPALGQDQIGGTDPGPCVRVESGGYQAGSTECAAARLEQAARAAQRRAANTELPDVPRAGSPDIVTGVASRSGTRLRLGNAFGNSVTPQRPARPTYAPLGGIK